MANVIRKVVSTTAIKGPAPNQFWFKASDETVDRDNEVIRVAGWKIANFLRAPTVLWAHDHDIPAIARAVRTEIRDGALWILTEFPPRGIHPLADTVHDLVDAKFIVSMSVGFRPIRSVQNAERGGLDYIEQELIEASIVNCGANPAALLQSRGLAADSAAVSKWLGADRGEVVLDIIDESPRVRSGRVLSAANEKRIRAAREGVRKADAHLAAVLQSMGDIAESPAVEPDDDDKAVLDIVDDASERNVDPDPQMVADAIGALVRPFLANLKEQLNEQVADGLARAKGRIDAGGRYSPFGGIRT